jgi:hypothetical protein
MTMTPTTMPLTTVVVGFNSFDALSLLGVIAIVIVGMAIGWSIYNYQIKKYRV